LVIVGWNEEVATVEWDKTGGLPWIPYTAPTSKDTSLLASIERMEERQYSSLHPYGKNCDCEQCDSRRCLVAARKWDLRQAVEASVISFSAEGESSDQDDVGAEWRLLEAGDRRPDGYEYRHRNRISWSAGQGDLVGEKISLNDAIACEYRIRIEAETRSPSPRNLLGESWRDLNDGEVVKEGDWCIDEDCSPGDEHWAPARLTVGQRFQRKWHTRHRRRIKKSQKTARPESPEIGPE
jgi:hypothetical protein